MVRVDGVPSRVSGLEAIQSITESINLRRYRTSPVSTAACQSLGR